MTVERVRKLVKPAGSKPVWGFVEVGHPFTEQDWPSAKPAQVVAGVWSSIIHGARGIIYFNHSFAGPCETQHALREDCYKDVRTAVTGVNAKIKELAPVLNAPSAAGVVEASAGVDISAKWYDGHYYLIAGSTKTTSQTASFTMQCVGDATVTVLHENRTIPAAQGAFTDQFADGNAVHIYRIDGGSTCDLPVDTGGSGGGAPVAGDGPGGAIPATSRVRRLPRRVSLRSGRLKVRVLCATACTVRSRLTTRRASHRILLAAAVRRCRRRSAHGSPPPLPAGSAAGRRRWPDAAADGHHRARWPGEADAAACCETELALGWVPRRSRLRRR